MNNTFSRTGIFKFLCVFIFVFILWTLTHTVLSEDSPAHQPEKSSMQFDAITVDDGIEACAIQENGESVALFMAHDTFYVWSKKTTTLKKLGAVPHHHSSNSFQFLSSSVHRGPGTSFTATTGGLSSSGSTDGFQVLHTDWNGKTKILHSIETNPLQDGKQRVTAYVEPHGSPGDSISLIVGDEFPADLSQPSSTNYEFWNRTGNRYRKQFSFKDHYTKKKDGFILHRLRYIGDGIATCRISRVSPPSEGVAIVDLRSKKITQTCYPDWKDDHESSSLRSFFYSQEKLYLYSTSEVFIYSTPDLTFVKKYDFFDQSKQRSFIMKTYYPVVSISPDGRYFAYANRLLKNGLFILDIKHEKSFQIDSFHTEFLDNGVAEKLSPPFEEQLKNSAFSHWGELKITPKKQKELQNYFHDIDEFFTRRRLGVIGLHFLDNEKLLAISGVGDYRLYDLKTKKCIEKTKMFDSPLLKALGEELRKKKP